MPGTPPPAVFTMSPRLARASLDWLLFHPGHHRSARPGEIVPSPVTDMDGWNQGLPRRDEDIHPVTDLMLSLRLTKASGAGLLFLKASDGRETFQVEIVPQKNQYRVLDCGRPLPAGAGALPFPPAGLRIEMSLFDQQLLLAMNGRVVVAWPYRRDHCANPPLVPLGIGAERIGRNRRRRAGIPQRLLHPPNWRHYECRGRGFPAIGRGRILRFRRQ